MSCNSSVGFVSGPLSCMIQHHGFYSLQNLWFSLGGNMGTDSIPKNSFRWEYKSRSSLYTHAIHCTDYKNPDIHVLDRWMPATKTQSACTIHECDYLYDCSKKRSQMQKSHPKMVNSRDLPGKAEEEEEEEDWGQILGLPYSNRTSYHLTI